jgi:hypothetical protein
VGFTAVPNRLQAVAVSVTVVLVLALAACTSSGTGGPPGPSTPATGPSATGSASGPGTKPVKVPSQHPLPTRPPKQTDKHRDVAVTHCRSTAHGWEAVGSATNASAKSVSYRITVYFTTKKATVIDYARAHVSVPAGQTGTWTARARFDTAGQDMLCAVVAVS